MDLATIRVLALLHRYAENVTNNPGIRKYRRVKLSSSTYHSSVGQHHHLGSVQTTPRSRQTPLGAELLTAPALWWQARNTSRGPPGVYGASSGEVDVCWSEAHVLGIITGKKGLRVFIFSPPSSSYWSKRCR